MGYEVFHGEQPTGIFVLERDREQGLEWVASQDRASQCCPWHLHWLTPIPPDAMCFRKMATDGRVELVPAFP